jgi:hypothetical protein
VRRQRAGGEKSASVHIGVPGIIGRQAGAGFLQCCIDRTPA